MLKKYKWNSFSAIIVILSYFLYSNLRNSPSLPPINVIFEAGKHIFSTEKFYINAGYTLKIVFLGIFISFIVGNIIALVCSMWERARNLIMPIINATKNVPSIALFPLFIVLMGIGDTPRVFVIIWNSIYPIISSTITGLELADASAVEAARVDGASEWTIYKYIKIPLATRNILEGVKISLGSGFIAIVVAEMLGANKGLGYMILWSSNAFNYPDMYVYILVIALLGLTFNVVIEKIIVKIERRLFDGYGKETDCSSNRNNDGIWFSRLRGRGRGSKYQVRQGN